MPDTTCHAGLWYGIQPKIVSAIEPALSEIERAIPCFFTQG